MKHTRARRLLVAALLPFAPFARAEDGSPKGVNPKENITKFDVIYKRDSYEGKTLIQGLALKYDQALDAKWGFNAEVPVVQFSVPGSHSTGLGDVQLRLRNVQAIGSAAIVYAAELVAPSASKDSLGTGKWQINPGVGAVFTVAPNVFVYAGYKHVLSVAGDSHRAKLNQSQPRVLAALTSPAGWWVMGDLKYTRDYEVKDESLDIEAEAGKMLSRNTAVAIRLGTSRLDSNRQFGLSMYYRMLF